MGVDEKGDDEVSVYNGKLDKPGEWMRKRYKCGEYTPLVRSHSTQRPADIVWTLASYGLGGRLNVCFFPSTARHLDLITLCMLVRNSYNNMSAVEGRHIVGACLSICYHMENGWHFFTVFPDKSDFVCSISDRDRCLKKKKNEGREWIRWVRCG